MEIHGYWLQHPRKMREGGRREVFDSTSAEAVKAAQISAATAERPRQAECDKRGSNCSLRETEEATKLEALTTAQTNKALTDQAAKLDREIKAVTAKLDQASHSCEY